MVNLEWGTKKNQNSPQLLQAKHTFGDILCFQNISLAMGQESNFYVWGTNFGNRCRTPHPVQFNSFQEIIDYKLLNNYWVFSLKPLTFEELFHPIKKVVKTISKAFNNPKNSDLKFKVKLKGSDVPSDF